MPVKLTDKSDEYRERLAKLRDGVSMRELFSDDFMSRHTQFKSWNEMLQAGGIEPVEKVNAELLSELITAKTPFAGLTEMQDAAWQEWVKRELNT